MSQLKASPNADNILAGADGVFITLPGDTYPTHFGHIEPLNVNHNLEPKELVGQAGGVIGVVKRRVIHKKSEYKFKAYERTLAILKAFFMGGATSTATQTAATDESESIATITGAADESEVVSEVWYPLAKRGVSNLTVTDGASPSPETLLVEDTDYKVDYHAGRIAFLRTLTAGEFAYNVVYDCEAQSQQSFSKFAATSLTVVGEVWRYFEDGNVVEKETLPKCYLEQDGAASDLPEDNTFLPFNLVQVPHATLGWGTITRVDRG